MITPCKSDAITGMQDCAAECGSSNAVVEAVLQATSGSSFSQNFVCFIISWLAAMQRSKSAHVLGLFQADVECNIVCVLKAVPDSAE